jgi:hypothetical protein
MDNFKKLRGWGWSHFTKMNLWRQDKGHNACVRAFVEAVSSGGPFPIAFSELVEVSEITLRVNDLIMKAGSSSGPVQGGDLSVRTLKTEEYH